MSTKPGMMPIKYVDGAPRTRKKGSRGWQVPAVITVAATDADAIPEHEARVCLDRITGWVVAFPHAEITYLYAGRGWVTLGYESWDAMCEAEIRPRMPLIPPDIRRETVGMFRESGMSTRAIASAVGVSDAQVRRDVAVAGAEAPEIVVGLDGRARSSARPATAPGSAFPRNAPQPIDPDWMTGPVNEYSELMGAMNRLIYAKVLVPTVRKGWTPFQKRHLQSRAKQVARIMENLLAPDA